MLLQPSILDKDLVPTNGNDIRLFHKESNSPFKRRKLFHKNFGSSVLFYLGCYSCIGTLDRVFLIQRESKDCISGHLTMLTVTTVYKHPVINNYRSRRIYGTSNCRHSIYSNKVSKGIELP